MGSRLLSPVLFLLCASLAGLFAGTRFGTNLAGPGQGELALFCDLSLGPLATGELWHEALAGQKVCLGFALSSGDTLDLVAHQEGADVAVLLHGSHGERLLRMDSPNGVRGTEPLAWVAEEAGRLLVVLETGKVEPGGGFRLDLRRLGPASARDRRYAAAIKAHAEAEELRRTKEPASIERAFEWYTEAAAKFSLSEEGEMAARSLVQKLRASKILGDLLYDRAEFAAAESAFDRGVAWAEAATTLGDEALLHQALLANGVGISRAAQGKWGGAEAAFSRSIALHHQLGGEADEAAATSNLGDVFLDAGDAPQALELYRKAIELYPETGKPEDRAALESKLGWGYLKSKRTRQAELHFQQLKARALRESSFAAEALAEAGLARLHYEGGRFESARESYLHLADLAQRAADRLGQATAIQNAAWCELRLGDPLGAEQGFEQARQLAMGAGSPRLDGAIEAGWARAAQKSGKLHQAREHILRALEHLEELRAGTERLDWRTSHLAAELDSFDSARDILLALDTAEPGQGFRAEAFLVSERARARALLDTLSFKPRLVGLEQVQANLLDEQTSLLMFDLGTPTSVLWWVSKHEALAVELPAEAELEAQAERVTRLLASGDPEVGQDTPALTELSRLLFSRVATRIVGHRLLLVPDGGLWALPFEALPTPRGQGLLLEDHEILRAPSASVALALRERLRVAASGAHGLALLADPVFSRRDDRFTVLGLPETNQPGAEPNPENLRLESLARLPASQREVEVLEALVPEPNRAVVTGFEATKEWVLAGSLSGKRWVHFATHGLLDSERPELSGLVLTLWDNQGRPLDGFLSAAEVAALTLDAELVVLAACETGLGRKVGGEGLVGLPQAFFRAGARQVLVSLWNVRDKATAELFRRFYHLHLGSGLPASTALRQAQLSMAAEPAWSRPRDWAAFVLQGAW